MPYSPRLPKLHPNVLVPMQSAPTSRKESWISATTSGRVRLRTSLQPSWPSNSFRSRSYCCRLVPMAPSATTTRSASARRRLLADVLTVDVLPRQNADNQDSLWARPRRSALSQAVVQMSTIRRASPVLGTRHHQTVGSYGDRTRRGASAGRPGDDRRLRRVERRGRGGDRRGGPPDLGVVCADGGRDRPRGLLRLPGQPAHDLARPRRGETDHLADVPACRVPPTRLR